MDDIKRIQRPTDVPDYGLLNDLLWSDPSDTAFDWEDNERGVSYCFGKVVLGEFLGKYDFDLICRAHMVVEDGALAGCSLARLGGAADGALVGRVRVLERPHARHDLQRSQLLRRCAVVFSLRKSVRG